MSAEARWGVAGLALLVVGAALAWSGFGTGTPLLQVAAIIVLVLALVALRARAWIRKTRALTQVGRDLHVDDE